MARAWWAMRSGVRICFTGFCSDYCPFSYAISILLVPLLFFGRRPSTATTRLKDLVFIEGVRDNQLVGLGVVVGLNKTGDKQQTIFSAQTLANMLQKMGVSVNPTAITVLEDRSGDGDRDLPPFAQPGTKLDVTAAAVGDASNLQGGLLLMTSLRGTNGQVYAVAQGPSLPEASSPAAAG